MTTASALAALLCATLLPACSPRADFVPPREAVLLPIPDRPWEVDAATTGWCGETCVQMAALHFGVWTSQVLLNRLAQPAHPDLWEGELPRALEIADLAFETWPGRGEGGFLSWTVGQLQQGHPVIVGVKLMPVPPPEVRVEVDHFVLAVGAGPDGLVINTNLPAGRQRVPWAALRAKDGLSLTSPGGRQYGWAVLGRRSATTPVRLTAVDEVDGMARPLLRVELSGLSPGVPRRLQRSGLDGGVVEAFTPPGPSWSTTFQACEYDLARFQVLPAP